MTLTADEITHRRRDAEKRIAEARRERGAAMLDSKPLDEFEATIAEATQEIEVLDEAARELKRRVDADAPFRERERYDANLVSYRSAEVRKLKALASAEKAAKALADALKAVMDAHVTMQAIEHGLKGQTNESVVSLPVRLGAFFRHTLRAAGLSGYCLGFQLHIDHEMSMAPKAGQSWADAEAPHSSGDWLEKSAPPVPEKAA